MTLDMCFIETLGISCTVSEILSQIDHKGPNLTFKMTFKLIPHLSYFMIGLISHQEELCYYWIISIIWENGLNLTFPTFKMTFWIIQSNPSLDSWSISSPRNCIQKVKKSYQTLDLVRTFRTMKNDFRAIQSNPSVDSSLRPSLGSFMHK